MESREPQQNTESQEIPANVYRSEERVMISAPMPGLEPDNIAVHVSEGPMVTLHAELRGALKGDKEIILDEWTAGPYHREIQLPTNVDGGRANVTYNNGVLVVSLPVSDRTTSADLTLNEVSATQGERVGNRGKNMQGGTGGTKRSGDATTSVSSGETA
ncbi:MAG TPA: Hsp20/alpha crystallin family protein [Dehalococcoidia bacterium]|jgi:HSP20 family protein|nr:Hsp20/alpha crystallin family protein [Dehalococcoidia bacterium]